MNSPCSLGIAASVILACAHAPNQRAISSAELRAEIDLHSCAYWEPEVHVWSVLWLDERCPRTPATTTLGRAVEAAIAEARLVNFLATAYDEVDAALTVRPTPTQPAADALVRAALWRDPLLERAVLDRALAKLSAHHLRCEDCQAPAAPAPRTVSWADFYPYLAAFVWPVQSDTGQIDVYTCSGINGAASLLADETLTQAGKLAALAFVMDDAMSRRILELARGPVSRSVPEVAREIEALLNSPEGRALACASLAHKQWFTGLTIEPC